MSGGLLLPGNLADKSSASQQTYTGNVSAPAIISAGLTGATQASRYAGATTSGAPVSGTFLVGDFVVDQTGTIWICTSAGTPGTWKQVTASNAATVTTNANLTGDVTSLGNTTTLTNSSNVQSVVQTYADPSGVIKMFAGSSAPTGWLVCDGSAISRATYSALFAVIGTTYGAGNGSTTFNIPDLRGRAAIGTGQGSGLTSRTLAQAGGEETHILTTTEMPSHNHGGATTGGANLTHGHGIYDPGHGHSIYDPGHNHGINGSTGENDGTNNWENRETYDWPYDTMVTSTSTTGIGINGNYTGISVNNSGSLSHDHTISSQGSSGAHNNMMPFAVLNYIIKL